jgi:hypothetical protein
VINVITHGKRITPTEEWLKFCNLSTARQLRSVLVTVALRQTAEKGRELVAPLLSDRGIVDLEDVMIQEREKFDHFLSALNVASMDDFYSALGGGAIRLSDVTEAFDEAGIMRPVLGWTTINIVGPSHTNRPGVLAYLAGLVSQFGGNILRTVNNTFNDGSFTLRWVIKGLDEDDKQELLEKFLTCDIPLTHVEIV